MSTKSLDPKVFDSFTKLVAALVQHQAACALARNNAGQPRWFATGDDLSTRKKAFAALDRTEVNEFFKQAVSLSKDTPESALLVSALQHDFMAGLMRDLYHTRRGRLHRIAETISVADGLASPYGPLMDGVQRYMSLLTERNSLGTA